jgi:hypothetical protein
MMTCAESGGRSLITASDGSRLPMPSPFLANVHAVSFSTWEIENGLAIDKSLL